MKLPEQPSRSVTSASVSYAAVDSLVVGRDSSVGIATRYTLDGLGIESRSGGGDSPHPSRPVLWPTQSPTPWVPVHSWGLSGLGVALTTHPSYRRG